MSGYERDRPGGDGWVSSVVKAMTMEPPPTPVQRITALEELVAAMAERVEQLEARGRGRR